jgi:hypothetical protein
VRLAEARQFALSLPETTEEPHFEKSSFRVRGKIFATVPEGGMSLHLFVDEDEVRSLVGARPDVYEPLTWGKRTVPDGVCVNLPAADRAQMQELLEEAWRRRAPKRVVAAFDAAAAMQPPTG